MLYSCTHIATVGFKGLNVVLQKFKANELLATVLSVSYELCRAKFSYKIHL